MRQELEQCNSEWRSVPKSDQTFRFVYNFRKVKSIIKIWFLPYSKDWRFNRSDGHINFVRNVIS